MLNTINFPKRALKLFMFLSVIAWPITIYLAYNHFNPSGSKVCNLSEFVSCDVVNLSPYSELFGIPVSILGLITYIILFSLAVILYKDFSLEHIYPWLNSKNVLLAIGIITLGGLIFSLYLTYVELFILQAICIFCITQQTIILILFGLWVYIMKACKTHDTF